MTLQLHQRVWTYSSVVSSVVSRRNPPLAPNIKNYHKMIKQQFSCLTDREIQNTSVVILSLVECCVQHINFTFIIKTSLHLITQTKNCAARLLSPKQIHITLFALKSSQLPVFSSSERHEFGLQMHHWHIRITKMIDSCQRRVTEGSSGLLKSSERHWVFKATCVVPW